MIHKFIKLFHETTTRSQHDIHFFTKSSTRQVISIEKLQCWHIQGIRLGRPKMVHYLICLKDKGF